MALFICSTCSHQQETNDSAIGKTATCPKCECKSVVIEGKLEPKVEPESNVNVSVRQEPEHPTIDPVVCINEHELRNKPVLVLKSPTGATLEVLLVYTETCPGSHLGGHFFKAFTSILDNEKHVTSKAVCRITDVGGNVFNAVMFMWQIEEFIADGVYLPPDYLFTETRITQT